jgi:uncharacterized membrane protein
MVVATAAGLAYPFFVYIGLGMLPPWALALCGLGLLAARVPVVRRLVGKRGAIGVVLACLGLMTLLLLSPLLAVRAYPVAVSLTFATVFAQSLRFPPTVIEQLARIAQPRLSSAGVSYTRKVTWVWFGFLLANSAIAAVTAVWGSLEVWTLWNGLLFYLAMGALLAGEFVARRVHCSRHLAFP